MEENLIICIPGKWESREDFLKAVITSTTGNFMFAGGILANPPGNDHIALEFYDAYEGMAEAFQYGGQGKISNDTLTEISQHKSVVYLLFPLDIVAQKYRIATFTKVLAQCGGIAVKLETSGNAHEWTNWFRLIESDNPFDQYCASVILVADESYYYSCGMHSFGLPDAQISKQFDIKEATDLVNRFNFYQIVEKPNLQYGHTFSLNVESPSLRLNLIDDIRHQSEDLFHNSKGLWDLKKT